MLIYVFLTSCGLVLAQEKTSLISLGGKVRDSTLNYNVEGASIALYNLKDTSLLLSGLTDRSGNFKFKTALTTNRMLLVVSSLGYASLVQQIASSSNPKDMDFGTLFIDKKAIEIEAINVGPPPVRMNKDTIEFFADAYKLKASATLDDLIRKFPGLIVWGDGSITYNGNKVPRVKVNGKDFLGGDVRMATYNLPKDAVQKVQLYNKNTSISNRDTVYEMNVKLKDSKSNGLFGKITYGYGNKKHYGGDIALNYFTDKMQLSTAYAANNTNKVVNAVGDLLLNTTFKSNTSKSDYEPDFKRKGTNEYQAAGYVMQYDLLKNKKYPGEEHLIKSNFFFKKNKGLIKEIIKQDYLQGIDLGLSRTANTVSLFQEEVGDFDISYVKNRESHAINIQILTSFANNTQDLSNNSSVALNGLLNNSTVFESKGANKLANYSISGDYQKKMLYDNRILPLTFNVSTKLDRNVTRFEGTKKTEYRAYLAPENSKEYARNYDNQAHHNRRSLSLTSMPLQRLIFGSSSRINLFLHADLLSEQKVSTDLIYDIDTIAHSLTKNSALSNDAELSFLNKSLGINLNRSYDLGSLTNRYERQLTLSSALNRRFINQKNKSTHAFQNLNRAYQAFLPELSIVFYNSIVNNNTKRYAIKYIRDLAIPGIEQLAPLVDSINIYDLYIGNPDLKESLGDKFSFNFSYIPAAAKKNINMDLDLNYYRSANFQGRTTLANGGGIRQLYQENMSGFDRYSLQVRLSNSFHIKEVNRLLATLEIGADQSHVPFKINTYKSISKVAAFNSRISLNYSFKELLFLAYTVSINNTIYRYSTNPELQSATRNSTLNLAHHINISWNVFDIINLTSNLKNEYNSSSTGFKNSYYLWNVSLNKRFRSQKDLEVNFGVYDILKQNKSIFFNSDPSVFMTTEQNTISNYYFLSLAYYPRYFYGKKK